MNALRGLYAITPTALCLEPSRLLAAVDAALRGGARLIQYRDKSSDPTRRLESARALRALCARHGGKLIVNDDVELALAAQAHGVHLGLDDLPLSEARARLGPDCLIGVTCQDSLHRARAASAGGADYLAFGAFFVSRTKPDARRATLALLCEARIDTSLPICAIGGITADNAGPLIDAGADLIAAAEGVFGAADVEIAARRYARCFT
ncbi:thiamine phosphate synthase [Panacagrimonas sp.]|uniref:thiamine phosphate synthase n=1 Tax=Panacagrimonas sp. TaxID=2480088 RepID=UPI003B51DBC2